MVLLSIELDKFLFLLHFPSIILFLSESSRQVGVWWLSLLELLYLARAQL